MERQDYSKSLQELSQDFGIKGRVSFELGPDNDWVFCRLRSAESDVVVSQYGAHITSYKVNEHEVLWLSPDAEFLSGKAIRGGIPICWPWFGPHPTDSSKPNHGFVRSLLWSFVSSQVVGNATIVELQLRDNEASSRFFDFPFCLTLEIKLCESLSLSLTTTNESDSVMQIGGALHSYFHIDDLAKTTIHGLRNVDYLDQLNNNSKSNHSDLIRFDREIDRVYLDSQSELTVEDGRRKIVVGKSGSQTTIVWNPWIDKAGRISDMPDDGYKSFVCVETANAFADVRQLNPGESHVLAQTIQLERG